jgi:AcrR family transcriptional regulator
MERDGSGEVGVRPDRRVARRLANRRTIEDAALRRFAENGFENTTVDEIAAAAGVSVRSFHYHFPNKRDVLVGDLPGRSAALAAALAARPESEHPLAAFRAALHAMGNREDERERVLLRARILHGEPHLVTFAHDLFRDFSRVIAEDVARRCGLDPDRDAYPRLVAAVAVSAMGATVMSVAPDDRCGQGTLEGAIDEALDAVLAGLPVPCTQSAGTVSATVIPSGTTKSAGTATSSGE